MTRTAISPRLATSTRSNMALDDGRRRDGLELEQERAILDGLCVLGVYRAHDTGRLGLELVEQLHRLEDAEHLARDDGVPHVDERRRTRVRSAVEDSDHRRLDARDAVGRRSEREYRLRRLDARANMNRNRRKRLVGATH